MTAVNVLGVLTRIDLRDDGTGDPWPVARRIGARYASLLAGVASDVIPVAGLLAQTATGDEFTDADAMLLRRLTAAQDDDLRKALFSQDTFEAWEDGPLARPERQRLLGLLGSYGILVADQAIREGLGATADDLLTVLRSKSGIDGLTGRIEAELIGPADRLRAGAAIGRLLRASYLADDLAGSAALASMRSELLRLNRQWQLRQAHLSPALADLASGRLQLPPEDTLALELLVRGDAPASCLGLPVPATATAIGQAADEQARQWRRLEWWPSLSAQRWARRARELCEALYFDAIGEGP
jgi:hypothetical protein